MIAFGPVPSRRLGRSMGINNIPPKICTYSCIYCQLGRTPTMRINRQQFYSPREILEKVEEKIKKATEEGEHIDYLTVVPDGEPTLDENLGKEIELLKKCNIKIAVISNASLLWKADIRQDLLEAEWVSVKVDAVTSSIWQEINRPHRKLSLEKILGGITQFSQEYKGELTTETMLVHNVNDAAQELEKIADFVAQLNPVKSYLSVPTRPPAELWVNPASEKTVTMAYQVFTEKSLDAECLTGFEGDAFAFTGDVEEDLLSITSVHPMREEGIIQFLTKANAGWGVIEELIRDHKLVEVTYENKKFYIRNFSMGKGR